MPAVVAAAAQRPQINERISTTFPARNDVVANQPPAMAAAWITAVLGDTTEAITLERSLTQTPPCRRAVIQILRLPILEGWRPAGRAEGWGQSRHRSSFIQQQQSVRSSVRVRFGFGRPTGSEFGSVRGSLEPEPIELPVEPNAAP